MERLRRGDVWKAEFGDSPRGSEPAFERPVVIIQDDLLNDSSLGTVMVAPVTSSARRAKAMGTVWMTAGGNGLSVDSVVLVCQVMSLDRSQFLMRLGSVSRRQLAEIDRGLVLALGLGR